ncbi:MAG: autotransporter outer membrane beta-barrel domain-containing protein [Rhizomicrobium sp.]
MFVVPSASLQYIGSEIDPFTETGGAPALSFAGYSESSMLSRLGFDAKMPLTIFEAKVTPSVHAFWVDNFEGNNGSIQAAFAGAPGSIMTFGMASRDRSYGELGFGIGLDLGDVLGHPATLTGRYDGTTPPRRAVRRVDGPPLDQVLIEGQKPERKRPRSDPRPFCSSQSRFVFEILHIKVVIARLVRTTHFSHGQIGSPA